MNNSSGPLPSFYIDLPIHSPHATTSTTPQPAPINPTSLKTNTPHPQPTPTIKTWANLFNENRDLSKCKKLEPLSVDKDKVKLMDEDLFRMDEAWGFCLIGYIVGRFPGKEAVEAVCNSWNVPFKYSLHGSGWLIFKFERQEDADRVLENGPYSTFGKPWVLKTLPRFCKFDESVFSAIPTWIKMHGLPLECWKDKALSKITSFVGAPIAMDVSTTERLKPAFARVLVEVNATKPLIKNIPIELPNGVMIYQEVEYEYEPVYCAKCSRIGHKPENCKSRDGVQAGKNPRGRSRSRKPTMISTVVDSLPPVQAQGSKASIEGEKKQTLPPIPILPPQITPQNQSITTQGDCLQLQANPVLQVHPPPTVLADPLPLPLVGNTTENVFTNAGQALCDTSRDKAVEVNESLLSPQVSPDEFRQVNGKKKNKKKKNKESGKGRLSPQQQ